MVTESNPAAATSSAVHGLGMVSQALVGCVPWPRWIEVYFASSYGPCKCPPLKWMRCDSASAVQTSVAQEISPMYLVMSLRFRKAVTKIKPGRASLKRCVNSLRRLASTGP